MKEKVNFRWRYQPSETSSAGVVLSYIEAQQAISKYQKTQLIMAAVLAYYLPVAYAAGELSDEERERIAWESVFSLLRQVDYLCSVFKLDRTCFGTIRPLGVEPIERMVTTKPKKKRTQQLEEEDTSALSGFEFLYSLNEKFPDSSDENN